MWIVEGLRKITFATKTTAYIVHVQSNYLLTEIQNKSLVTI